MVTAAADTPAQPAQLGPASTLVKQTNDTINTLLKTKAPADKVRDAVKGLLDIDALGKAALVDHWKTLTAQQQKDFLKLLNDLINANYVKSQTANLNYKVSYLGESTNAAGNVVVTTQIDTQRKGRPLRVAVDYELVKSGSTFRAFDIKTDGVGLVENYRAQFNKIIKDKGFQGVLDLMTKKLAQLQAADTAAPPAKS